MIVTEIIGNIATVDTSLLHIDKLAIEWYEAPKRIQRHTTESGTELALKLVKQHQHLHDGDILFQDDTTAIVVYIKPCDVIVMQPTNMLDMATICYEIGNKHLPLFTESDTLLMPYEAPMFNWLAESGYAPQKTQKRLLHRLRASVAPHHH